MINLRLSSLLDLRVIFVGKLIMLAVLLLTLMAARGEIATADVDATAAAAAAAATAAATAAFYQNLVLLAGVTVPALVTVSVLVINRRSDAKAKDKEIKAAADAKAADAMTAALVKAAENAERRAEKEEDRQRQAAQAAELKAAAIQTAAKADEVAVVLKQTTATQVENSRVTSAKGGA